MLGKDYVDIMIQSLKKKNHILELIQVQNQAQSLMLVDPDMEIETLQKSVDTKGELISELTILDDGFQQTFDRIRSEIDQNRQQYALQIKEMQELIREISERSNEIQIQEQKNKQLAQKQFASMHKQVRQVKTSYSQVNKYYQNMMHMSANDAQYVDHKK
ncbi:MAG: flagellar protein FliT [Lachnospiraceae bacterium]